jgi:hypothetical protein
MPRNLTAAVMLLFLGGWFTQSTLLCEFHGVSLYYVLIPWLFYCLARHKNLTWLPLLLLLGLREDAALPALPMLLYFAVKDRWRAGYYYAAVTALYGALAMGVLFPLINHQTLGERREKLISAHRILNSFGNAQALQRRAVALFWLFLPALPLLWRRGWVPILALPSLQLIVLLVSPNKHHHGLGRHYSAAVLTLLVLGLMEAWRRTRRAPPQPRRVPEGLALALFLMAVTLAGYLMMGALPGGDRSDKVFEHSSDLGHRALDIVPHIPKTGVLITDKRLSEFVANRADLLTFDTLRGPASRVDLIFAHLTQDRLYGSETLPSVLASGDFGVIHLDRDYILLKRGADTNRNGAAQAAIASAQDAFGKKKLED